MRLFLAIDLPPEIRRTLYNLQSELKFVRGKPVEEENMHVTLKFLGEVSPSIYEKIRGALTEIKFSKFNITLKGVGAFPNENKPRVIWVGVGSGKERLVELQKKIDKLLARFGFPLEYNYVPHVTLIRVKQVFDRKRLLEFFKKYSREEFGTFNVVSFFLKKSTLTPKGPVYENLAEYPLL